MGFFNPGTVHPENWRDHLPEHTRLPFAIMVILIVMLLVIMSRLPGKTKTYVAGPRENSWTACVTYAQQQLGLAVSGAQTYSPGAVTLLSDNQYQVELTYPQKNLRYRCTVEQVPDTHWQVTGLQAR
jgi:hypothetical protein